MKLDMEHADVHPEEIDRAVNDLVTSSHQDDFREIGAWFVKTGLGEKGAREKMVNELSTRISKEISGGIVQVTLQELEGGREIKAKCEQQPPDLYPHIDFIVKSGALDVWTTTYWFKVTSKVVLDNVAITMKKNQITGITSGIMQVFITLAYCGHNRGNPQPFSLLKNKKVIDLDLAKVVRF